MLPVSQIMATSFAILSIVRGLMRDSPSIRPIPSHNWELEATEQIQRPALKARRLRICPKTQLPYLVHLAGLN